MRRFRFRNFLVRVCVGYFIRRHRIDDPDAPPQPLPCFACGPCHQINDESEFRSQGWNLLIAHVSAGLLYGREVPQPPDYRPARKKRYVPRPAMRTSKLQAKILPLLIETTLTPCQIAKTLRLRSSSVYVSIARLLRHHNVTNREELRRVVGERVAGSPTHKAAG